MDCPTVPRVPMSPGLPYFTTKSKRSIFLNGDGPTRDDCYDTSSEMCHFIEKSRPLHKKNYLHWKCHSRSQTTSKENVTSLAMAFTENHGLAK